MEAKVTPEVTVMMPVHNARPYVQTAVESILGQTFSNFRLLVVDDGSDDGSGEILDELARADARVQLIRRERRGQVETRNELLARATTELLACADADDISLPNRLADQVQRMKKDPDLHAIGCQLHVVDHTGLILRDLRRPVGAEVVRAAFKRGTAVSQPSAMIRRSALLAIGGYRSCYEHAEDYDMFIRVAENGKIDNGEFFGIYYRVHDDSVSHRHAIRQMASADLARATHALRIAGRPDPTHGLRSALPYEDPIMKALVPSAAIYAALEQLRDEPSADPLRKLLGARIDRRQSRCVQRALVDVLLRRDLDALSLLALIRAVSMGPGRFMRCVGTAVRKPRRLSVANSETPAPA
ncbi:glycosyltransferase family A protein [Hyphomicrobium sp. D-2]|uniref:glycosyltransferase family 2 protein n=1 Tax=Hyphomicrobium sp. D-2 TaxID=3041621 RepID=UPI00245469D5|nr:glycosyltransferase family A protein [Hyphomicrobium sp. D-2]MDH4981182.1 glycosyltransferase family A protein [Hyphomicrobium sp. D-2]